MLLLYLHILTLCTVFFVGEGPRAHLQKLSECIRWSYGAGIILRLGNIARLELNYCFPMGVQSGDRYTLALIHRQNNSWAILLVLNYLQTYYNLFSCRICDGVQFGAGIRFL